MTKDISTNNTIRSDPFIKRTKILENRTNTTNIARQIRTKTIQTQTTGINIKHLFGFPRVTKGNKKANQEAKD